MSNVKVSSNAYYNSLFPLPGVTGKYYQDGQAERSSIESYDKELQEQVGIKYAKAKLLNYDNC